MYYPKEEQIKRAGPTPGMFYWPTRALNVAEIARVAAKNSPTPISTANMVILIANSRWNHHIRYSKTGYTAYGIEGPQMEAKYSATDYTAGHGSGTSWPMLWIPTTDGKEPEDVYGTPGPAVEISPLPSGGGGSAGGGSKILPGGGLKPGSGTYVPPGSRPAVPGESSGGGTGSGGGGGSSATSKIVAAGVGGGSSSLVLLLLLLGAGAVGWMYVKGSNRKGRGKRKKRR